MPIFNYREFIEDIEKAIATGEPRIIIKSELVKILLDIINGKCNGAELEIKRLKDEILELKKPIIGHKEEVDRLKSIITEKNYLFEELQLKLLKSKKKTLSLKIKNIESLKHLK